jgi:hypothetical protein
VDVACTCVGRIEAKGFAVDLVTVAAALDVARQLPVALQRERTVAMLLSDSTSRWYYDEFAGGGVAL